MNVEIKKGNTTIEFLNFREEKRLCSGIGTFEFTTPLSYSFNPYDVINVYLNGKANGVYYVSSISRDYAAGTQTVSCQDGSKLLVDYYYINNTPVSEPTAMRYLIEQILNETGVNYEFLSNDYGSIAAPDTIIGTGSAYDLVNQFIQQSGWYFYFDKNGVMQIGDPQAKEVVTATLTGSENILEIKWAKDSEMLRNKAIVWGRIDPETQQPIAVSVERETGYEMTPYDVRPIVVSSPNIYYTSDAQSIASKLINEFSELTHVKTVETAGFYPDTEVGTFVNVESRYWSGSGLITSRIIEFSPSGARTTFILDERCPRLTSFFYYNGYVYIGTRNNGVWRKPIRWKHIWENFSNGIASTDLEVTDLKVKNGIFACIAGKKLYVRGRSSSAWVKVNYSDTTFYDSVSNSYSLADNVYPCGTAIDDSGRIFCVFSDLLYNRAWKVEVSSDGSILNVSQIFVENNKNIRAFDIEFYNGQEFISGVVPGSWYSAEFSGAPDTYVGHGTPVAVVSDNKIINIYTGDVYLSGGTYYLHVLVEKRDLITSQIESYTDTELALPSDSYGSNPSVLSFLYKDSDYIYLAKEAGNSTVIFAIDRNSLAPSVVKVVTVNNDLIFGPYYQTDNITSYSTSSIVNYITNEVYLSDEGVEYSPFPYYGGIFGVRNRQYVIGVDEGGHPIERFDQWIVWYNTITNEIYKYYTEIGSQYSPSTVYIYSVTVYGDTRAQIWFSKDGNHYILEMPSNNISSFTPNNISSRIEYYNRVWILPATVQDDFIFPNIINGTPDPSIRMIVAVSNDGRYIYYFPESESSYVPLKVRDRSTNTETNLYIIYDYPTGGYLTYNYTSITTVYESRFDSGVYIVRVPFEILNLKYNYLEIGFPHNIIIFDYDKPFTGEGPAYFVGKKSTDNYAYVGYTSLGVNLESGPALLTYPLPATSYQMEHIIVSGIYNQDSNLGIVSDLKYTFDGSYGSLMPVISGAVLTSISGYPVDTRGFYQTSSGVLNVWTPMTKLPSGTLITSVLEDSFVSSISGILTSGHLTRLESIGSLDYPFVFIAVSGHRMEFYQRDQSVIEQQFYNRTNNMPDDWINVIRADIME